MFDWNLERNTRISVAQKHIRSYFRTPPRKPKWAKYQISADLFVWRKLKQVQVDKRCSCTCCPTMVSKSVLTAAAPFAFVLRQMDVHLDGTRFDQWHHHGDLAAHKWTTNNGKTCTVFLVCLNVLAFGCFESQRLHFFFFGKQKQRDSDKKLVLQLSYFWVTWKWTEGEHRCGESWKIGNQRSLKASLLQLPTCAIHFCRRWTSTLFHTLIHQGFISHQRLHGFSCFSPWPPKKNYLMKRWGRDYFPPWLEVMVPNGLPTQTT